MKTSYDIIKHTIRTEKGSGMLAKNKYIFHVASGANKIQIKQAVEEIYNVTVKKVNTLKSHGKWKRVRYKEGKTPDWKKAVVTLKQGDKIEIATT
ncbi:MAG: 50S ribosomal protein L23 [Candidatus Omnitrophica bacterium CG12_big_fil_rev_8_21_14_0_65_42_8]|nr:MAG: 50S ribosomal protein L23 [Candidatus Omnitrophica bacterium CG12_big_fil_rev_8_21_14_0_65_42_8]